jgi:hypothetical protein
MVYLLNFNITYIIILATCFESYESSSGINFQELLYILFYSFMSYSFFCLSRTTAIGIPLCITKPELMSIWYINTFADSGGI